MEGLADLLKGSHTCERFFAEVWEQNPLHVRHGNGYLDGVFSLWDVEHAVRAADEGELLLRKNGEDCAPRPPHVAYLDGGSIIINHLDRVNANVAALCQRLARDLVHCYCVMYLTPPGARAVVAHSDHQDVFILQVAGRKTWQVYGPDPSKGALVYAHEQVGKPGCSAVGAGTHGAPDLLLADLAMEEGDVLYIPRGFVHEARAPPGAGVGSLHLTITVPTHDYTIGSLLLRGMRSALRHISMGHVEARAGSETTSGEVDETRSNAGISVSSNVESSACTGASTVGTGGDIDPLLSRRAVTMCEPQLRQHLSMRALFDSGKIDDVVADESCVATPPAPPRATGVVDNDGHSAGTQSSGRHSARAAFDETLRRTLASLSFDDAIDAFAEHVADCNRRQRAVIQRQEKNLSAEFASVLRPDSLLCVMPGMTFEFAEKSSGRSGCASGAGSNWEMIVRHQGSTLAQGIGECHLELFRAIARTAVSEPVSRVKAKGSVKAKAKAKAKHRDAALMTRPGIFRLDALPGDDSFAKVCVCMLLLSQTVLRLVET